MPPRAAMSGSQSSPDPTAGLAMPPRPAVPRARALAVFRVAVRAVSVRQTAPILIWRWDAVAVDVDVATGRCHWRWHAHQQCDHQHCCAYCDFLQLFSCLMPLIVIRQSAGHSLDTSAEFLHIRTVTAWPIEVRKPGARSDTRRHTEQTKTHRFAPVVQASEQKR
jgi:hypothetical protein